MKSCVSRVRVLLLQMCCPEPRFRENIVHALSVGDVSKNVSGCLSNAVKADIFEKVKAEEAADGVCQALMTLSLKGWPKFSSLSTVLRPYWQERATLTVADGVLLNGVWFVIPQKLRTDILMRLHERHQGIQKCRAGARE